MSARVAVVVPTYNNARTLGRVVEELVTAGHPVIVVNDGSTDATPDVLARVGARFAWRAGEPAQGPSPGGPSPAGVRVEHHATNQGKAGALKTGFTLARRDGFTHALTFDSDGQMRSADATRLAEAARRSPDALILGWRRTDIPGYPSKNRLGRRLSNGAIFLECGRRVRDSQCGLRVYPLELVDRARCRAGRFGFEAEILTRAAWLGFPFVQVPIECLYEIEEGRVTHFRPGMDTWRSLRLHASLMGRAPAAWLASQARGSR